MKNKNLYNAMVFGLVSVVFASVLILSGCNEHDKKDRVEVTAHINYNDGATPLADQNLRAYNLAFNLKNGSTTLKRYAGPTVLDDNSTLTGIRTDADGTWTHTDPNAYLHYDTERLRCYDVCIDSNTECYDDCYYDDYWDEYSCDSYCSDYCSWYTTECYWEPVTYTYDFDSVSSTEASIEYDWQGSVVTSYGQNIKAERQATVNDEGKTKLTNTWLQEDKFTTVFDVPGAAQAGKSQAMFGENQTSAGADGQVLITLGKSLQCKEADQLTDAEKLALDIFREGLGVTSSDAQPGNCPKE